MTTIYTIGFAGKSAEEFFDALEAHCIKRLVDVRLRNSSQLAGYTKRDDLAYFLRRIGRIKYEHEPLLATTDELLDAYRGKKVAWDDYEVQYNALLVERQVESKLKLKPFARPTVLLCAEQKAENCHRRLAAEYLAAHWPGVDVKHM